MILDGIASGMVGIPPGDYVLYNLARSLGLVGLHVELVPDDYMRRTEAYFEMKRWWDTVQEVMNVEY